MKRYKSISLLVLLFFLSSHLMSQDENPSIFPGPEPFSLDSQSAIYCISLLRENPLLLIENDSGQKEILRVKKVWSYFLNKDDSYPKGHRLRYDIIINETPLDWNRTFIEYGGEMINLRLLFTYRNQYPPEGLKYYN